MKGVRHLLLFLAVGMSFPAIAADKGIALQTIRDQQAEIRAGAMAGAGPYAKLSEDKRHELLDKQARLLTIIDGKQSADELSPSDRTEAFNILEWVEGTVNNESDERMVCERTRKTGTNRMVRTCRTERQWREARERARRQAEGSQSREI